MNFPQYLPSFAFLLVATTLEVSGDALLRMALYNYPGVGLPRLGLIVAAGALLLGYGTSLNLAPLAFREVVGLYIATLFVVWQVINFIAFRTLPTLPILLGGGPIVAGGLVITFWKTTLTS